MAMLDSSRAPSLDTQSSRHLAHRKLLTLLCIPTQGLCTTAGGGASNSSIACCGCTNAAAVCGGIATDAEHANGASPVFTAIECFACRGRLVTPDATSASAGSTRVTATVRRGSAAAAARGPVFPPSGAGAAYTRLSGTYRGHWRAHCAAGSARRARAALCRLQSRRDERRAQASGASKHDGLLQPGGTELASCTRLLLARRW